MNTVTFIKVTYLTMLCPKMPLRLNAAVCDSNSCPRAYACKVQTPMRERWVRLRATFTPWVIIQVSGSKFTLSHGFVGFVL